MSKDSNIQLFVIITAEIFNDSSCGPDKYFYNTLNFFIFYNKYIKILLKRFFDILHNFVIDYNKCIDFLQIT